MAYIKTGELFRLIRWHPGIQGTQRSFQLRTMTKDGRLWFACQDVQRTLGWAKREFYARRFERLEGNTWGTTTAQWEGRGQRLAFVSLTALQVVMAGRRTRHNRFFLRWLDSLDGTNAHTGASHSTGADHCTSAEQLSEVQYLKELLVVRSETSGEPLRLAA